MANLKTVPVVEAIMPTPGTLAHLEYLAGPDSLAVNYEDLEDFLSLTQATRSLGLFIKLFRTYRPIRTPTIDLDHRELKDGELISRFTGSIYRNPHTPRLGHLSLAGKGVIGAGDAETKYEYGALIPTHFNFSYDPSRHADAVLKYSEGDTEERSAYNEAAGPEYDEHNPQVPISVVRQAAGDLIRVIGFEPGKIRHAPEIKPLPDGYVRWHPDYLNDDPDEFVN